MAIELTKPLGRFLLLAMFLLLCAFNSSCSAENQGQLDTREPDTGSDDCITTPFSEIPTDLSREEAEQRVRQLVSDLRLHRTKPCPNQSNKQASVWSRGSYDSEEGPRILVLEEEIPSIFALGRYRRRIFDVLESDDTGKYSPVTELKVEGISAEFLQLIEITGRKSPYFSAFDLEKLRLWMPLRIGWLIVCG